MKGSELTPGHEGRPHGLSLMFCPLPLMREAHRQTIHSHRARRHTRSHHLCSAWECQHETAGPFSKRSLALWKPTEDSKRQLLGVDGPLDWHVNTPAIDINDWSL